jgi:hypothetical protein
MWATRWRCPHIHRPARVAWSIGAFAEIVGRGERTMARSEPVGLARQARRRPQRPSLVSAPCPTPCRARMPGQYSTHCELRPRAGAPEPAETPARLFLCGRCHAQVLICSRCDRGQIYCAEGCARDARRHAQRAAGQRYQTSRRGRLTHASRARRYRARQKNVTHQGSRPQPPNDLVSVGSAVTASKSPSASSGGLPRRSAGRGAETWHCHWCGCRCPQFVRHEFLRRHLARAVVNHRRGEEHDHPA